MATVVLGDFEWDDAKAASNLVKHGVSFDEALSVFSDPSAVFLADEADRFIVIGMSSSTRVLYVVHVTRGMRERIISARRATAAERGHYSGE